LSSIAEKTRIKQTAGACHDRIWLHVGSRIRFRRQQLDIAIAKAATHVGVAPQTYEEYETGARLIPADQLADVAELFRVPVFYFFEDLQVGDDNSTVPTLNSAFAVATETDRIATLIEDFQNLDFEHQQHLLLVARTLANDAK
jgi:transcriptional regulator with XRE-family HTH domain